MKTTTPSQNKRLYAILGAVPVLLSIPLIAMQFTREVNWSSFDFLIMAILLTGTAVTCEWVIRKVKKGSYRVAFCILTLTTFLLIWAELAVGIF